MRPDIAVENLAVQSGVAQGADGTHQPVLEGHRIGVVPAQIGKQRVGPEGVDELAGRDIQGPDETQ